MFEFIIAILAIAGYVMFYAVIGITAYVAYKVLQHEQQQKKQNDTVPPTTR